MVHGILQFTPSIAFRYVLHRCKSRDIRCRESFSYKKDCRRQHRPRTGGDARSLFDSSLARFAPGFVVRRADEHVARRFRAHLLAREKWKARQRGHDPHIIPREYRRVRGFSAWQVFDNDPSAGSPTETLLRLLLPLNDKVQWTSRDVAGSEPPTSTRSEHFTGPFNR